MNVAKHMLLSIWKHRNMFLCVSASVLLHVFPYIFSCHNKCTITHNTPLNSQHHHISIYTSLFSSFYSLFLPCVQEALNSLWDEKHSYFPFQPILIISQWMNYTWSHRLTLLITTHTQTHTHIHAQSFTSFTRSRIKANSSAQLQAVSVCKVTVILRVKWSDGKIHCQGKKWASSRPTLGKLICCKSNKWKLDVVSSLSSSHLPLN